MILSREEPTETISLYRQLFSDYEDSDDRGFTTLHRIILHLDDRDLGKYLRECPRVDINRGDMLGYTPLHWASRRGDSEMADLLLQEGADPCTSTNIGIHPLHLAAVRGDIRTIDHLLRYGADVNASTKTQYTPLLQMFSNPTPNLVCAKRLIDRGARINVQDFQGATPLLFASQFGFIPGLEFLLRNGAKIDVPNQLGETALTAVIQMNTYSSIPILFANGANPRHHSLSSRSILHEAAEYGDEQTLRLLTSARIRGVQTQLKSADGQTTWDLARKRTDATPQWRAAFADLVASLEESMPEPPSGVPEIPPRLRLSSMMRAVEDKLLERTIQVQGYSNHLSQLQVRLASALLVSCIAIAWYVLMRS